MNIHKNLHWLIYILFTLSCARQTSPTGGPKDTIPPILTESNPKNGQIKFQSKNIELTFSEAITLNNPKEQILIAPTVSGNYDVIPKKDRVVLTFEHSFRDSTTYSFNFREAVQDITEKNSVRNLKLAFSTGDYIDSLSVQGNIFNVLQSQPMANIYVAIQPYRDTLNFFKHKATYLTLTDKKGNFNIENLKPGTYSLYAFQDQNKNLIVDSRTEAYGFRSDTIRLTSNITNANIGIIKLDARPLKLTSARPSNTYFNIRSGKSLANAAITSPDTSILYYALSPDQSNVQLYNTFGKRDSLQIKIHLADSINNTLDTTVYAKFVKREVTPEKFDFQIKSSSIVADKGLFQAQLKFSKPIVSMNFDSIFYTIDSAKSITFQAADFKLDTLHNTATINKQIDKKFFEKPPVKPVAVAKPKTPQPKTANDTVRMANRVVPQKQPEKLTIPKPTNQLYFGKGAFISVEQDSSKKITQGMTPQHLEDLGMILVETQALDQNQSTSPAPSPLSKSKRLPKAKQQKNRDLSAEDQRKPKPDHIIIQILNKDYTIINSAKNVTRFTFENLPPAVYLLRIILDSNNNGIWDAGNYLKKEEPEKIIYYVNEKNNREINLKANFEIGPLLITY